MRDADRNYRLAPIYDNGGCLQSKISETKIEKVLADKQMVIKNSLNCQTVYGVNDNMLTSAKLLKLFPEHEGLRNAVKKVIPVINNHMDEITAFIYSIPEKFICNGREYDVCSNNRKELYLLQMRARQEKLLNPFYDKVCQFEQENMAGTID